MESFDQVVKQELDVKSEVSDSSLPDECEQFDDQSLPSSTQDSTKRSYEENEQDSFTDSNGNGSPLPPRKRAKTQEEKEQRRVERIMRNRQAAHASREKKRKHLEMLESKCSQLESENDRLKGALSTHDQLKLRVGQLEEAIKLAKSTGDVGSLDSIAYSTISPQSEQPSICGTVAGKLIGAGSPETDSSSHEMRQLSGSPAPSLEEDCASPEAFFIKSEEDLLPPFSPERGSEQFEDPFGMMNLSFDSNPLTSALSQNPDNSSKSRHPAALTQLLEDSQYLSDPEN